MTTENIPRGLYSNEEYGNRFPPIIVNVPGDVPHVYPLGTDYQITEDISLVIYHIPRELDAAPILIRKYLPDDWISVTAPPGQASWP